MKVNGFNSEIPPAGAKPDSQKSEAKLIAKKTRESSGNVSADSDAKNLTFEKDKISLNSQRPDNAKDSGAVAGTLSQDYIGRGELTSDAIYSPDMIARNSKEIQLAEIRMKIDEGYYDTPEFIEKLAGVLLDNFYSIGERDQ